MTEEQKRLKAKEMRYKKPIVKDLNFDTIRIELWEMQEACNEIAYLDDDTILNAFGDDDEDAAEFKITFETLAYDADRMAEDLENEYVPEYFDTFFAAIGAGDYGGGLMGFDSCENDYFGLMDYEEGWAEEEAQKKLERLTKKELIEAAGICSKVLFCYVGLKYRYDCLKASFDIIRGKALGYIEVIKEIDKAYKDMFSDDYNTQKKAVDSFERLTMELPEEVWLM